MKQVPVEVTRDALGWLLADKDGHPVCKGGDVRYYKTEAEAKKALKSAKVGTKQKYAVDWSVSGVFEVEASSAAEAEALFEKAFGSPRGIDLMRDGDPYVSEINLVEY